MGPTEEMRKEANEAMKSGLYYDARERYSSAINTSEKPDETLYVNRALAQYKLKCY